MDIVIIGLTITSSWGNGHATTYRGLVRELCRRGHRTLFLEHDKPWYAAHRDLPNPPFGQTELYRDVEQLQTQFAEAIRNADLVVVGSYVPEGIRVGQWVTTIAQGVTAFYDIDTPVTLAKLDRGECNYLSRELVCRYDLYLSFSGGPLLRRIEREYGARHAAPLYCSVDPSLYFHESRPSRWEIGYLGTYSEDRQPGLVRLLLNVAETLPNCRFVVAGPQYPVSIHWPANVERIEHIPPTQHREFFNSQRFTLNLTRADMIKAGYSPSVRLFEAAACGVAIISDWWEGLDQFLSPGHQILVAHDTNDVLRILRETSETDRQRLGTCAQRRVLAFDTAAHRALELEQHVQAIQSSLVTGGVR